jgi:dihydroorotase
MNVTRSEEKTAPYDLLLKGGTLIDPSQGVHAIKDIAFADGIVAVAANDIPHSKASEVVDCSGYIVAPGMIDLHVHVFWGVSHYGVEADPHCVAKGSTTAVDAGSAGADTFPGFRKYVIESSATRVLAFLNISSQGMVSKEVGELSNMEYANVDKAVAIIRQHHDVILGIKVRLTPKHSGISKKGGIHPLYRAREVADAVGLPIMVHPQDAWCDSIDEILEVMRKGDILTHCFHPRKRGILDGDSNVRKSVLQAMERGVIFDVGHGLGSFNWNICEQSFRQNCQPHTISSDLHIYNIHGPVYDLATTVSRFFHFGLSLDDALSKVTSAPARAIGMSNEIGTLKVGASGDAVVLELQEGSFRLWDANVKELPRQIREVKQKLVPKTVVRAGKVYVGKSNG